MPVTFTEPLPRLTIPAAAVTRAASYIDGAIVGTRTLIDGTPCLSLIISRPGDAYRFLARLGAELTAHEAAMPDGYERTIAESAARGGTLAAEIAARSQGIGHQLAALVYWPGVTAEEVVRG